MNLFTRLSFYFDFVKKYKMRVAIVLSLLILVELFTISERYLYKFFIDASEQFIGGTIENSIFVNSIIILLGIYLIFIIARALFTFYRVQTQNVLTASLQKDVKKFSYKHLLGLSYDFHTTNKSGTIITRFSRSERAIESITESLLDSTIPLIIQIILVLATTGAMHWSFALIILAGASSIIGVNILLQKYQLPKKLVANEAEDKEGAHISDTFTNMETIKLFGKEDRMDTQYQSISENTKNKRLAWDQYFRYFSMYNLTLPSLIMVILLGTGAYLFTQDAITLGDLVFVQAAFYGLIGPIRYFTWMFRGLYTGLYDLESIKEYINTKPTIVDKKDSQNIKIPKGEITFENVHFKYHKEKVFDNFSLSIKQGERVAIIGHSGSGKSTLVKLLYRLYDIQKGNVFIDAQNTKNVTQKSLRESMSIVPQEGILFDDTLLINIQFANPNASREQIEKAVEQAQLKTLLKRLPKGIHTIVGERGVRLSGGERQRVAIARALVANKKILILDEATSALDSQTENKIQKALKKLLEGKTAIIIAHRLSTIMHADKIVVLENGSIVEQGKHDALIRKNGRYAELWKLQKDGYIE